MPKIQPSYRQALERLGDPSGWKIPEWTLLSAQDAQKSLGVRVSVVSVTSPGPALLGPTEEGRKLARACNDECHEIIGREEGGKRFALFGSLPDWNDVQGTCEEVEYCMKILKCPGVVVMTTYGDRLLGNPKFAPVWKMLNDFGAIVFVHPASVNIQPHSIADKLPQPIIDYPQQTTRTAADLILTGTFTRESKCKIILSHAGGTLPFLADRLGMGSQVMHFGGDPSGTGLTSSDVADIIRLFYFDVALSTSPTSLYGLLQVAAPDRILFGSDFPYAPLRESMRQTERLDNLVKTDALFKEFELVNSENAEKLFGGVDRFTL